MGRLKVYDQRVGRGRGGGQDGWWTLEKTGCEVRHTDGQQGAAPKRRMEASRDQFIPGHPREHDFTGSGALVTC